MPEVEMLLCGFNANTDQARLGLSMVTLVRGSRNTLVDVGHFGRRQLLVQALEQRSLRPEQIDTIVLTHAHWDHSQNVDLFSNARIVVHSSEVEHSRHPNPGELATPRYFAKTLEGHIVVDAREGMELEAGVSILETPGHSAGHISVLVHTSEGLVIIAGDALSDAGALARGMPFLVFWDVEQARSSVQKIRSAASRVYPGHDRPFQLKRDGGVEYLVPAPTVHFSGILEHDGSTFGITLGLDPPRTTEVHPSARER
ncbi:MAG: MBL fold metallo-hydrolase [Chloroflexota bacterium]